MTLLRPSARRTDRCDLLPPSYRKQRQTRLTLHLWTSAVVVLTTVWLGVSISTAMRLKRQHQSRQNLAVQALPLMELRRNVFHLQDDNGQRAKWCRWVESARPDNNAFQTLAAVVAPTEGLEGQVAIETIAIRLPLEQAGAAGDPGSLANPEIAVSAQVASTGAADRWMHLLQTSDRIDKVNLQDQRDNLAHTRVQFSATPITTSVLP